MHDDINPQLSKRARNIKYSFGPNFYLFLVEGNRDEIKRKIKYCLNIEGDLTNYREAMTFLDAYL